MRESKNKEARCCECDIPWTHTRGMYEIQIGKSKVTICKHCEEMLFSKLLKLDCIYNGRLKSNGDLKRSYRENEWRKSHGQANV